MTTDMIDEQVEIYCKYLWCYNRKISTGCGPLPTSTGISTAFRQQRLK